MGIGIQSIRGKVIMSHHDDQREEELEQIAADELAVIESRAKVAELNEGKE